MNAMGRMLCLAAAAALLAGCGAAPAPAGEPAGRLLYLTHAAGYRHEVVPFSEEIVRELAERSGAFEVTVSRECCDALSAESLAGFDAVLFYTSGELPATEDQKAAFLAFVRGGGGFAGIHSATDTFYEWPEYGELVGGYFDEHPWHEEVAIRVEDTGHPATRHLGDSFRITDEIYQFRNWSRDRVHVLLSLDTASVDLQKKGVKRTDGDFGLAWTSRHGDGRVFYTALGHRDEVWQDERFQQHLLGGIRWVMKNE